MFKEFIYDSRENDICGLSLSNNDIVRLIYKINIINQVIDSSLSTSIIY